MDGLQVDLPRPEEVAGVQRRIGLERVLERDPYRVLDEARLEVCMLDDEQLVRPLQQLVDRGAHRALDDLHQVFGVDRLLGADVQRPAAALVVRCERDELEDAVDVALAEAGLEQPLRRTSTNKSLCAGTGVDPGCLHADDAARTAPGRRRDPDQRNELLRAQTGDRGEPLHRIAGDDLDLGAQRPLPLEDVPSDVLREHLDVEDLVDHYLVDRLLEQLGEAGHVHALPVRVEVDGAVDRRCDELLPAAPPDADSLLDAGHSDAREAERDFGGRRLEVGGWSAGRAGHRR